MKFAVIAAGIFVALPLAVKPAAAQYSSRAYAKIGPMSDCSPLSGLAYIQFTHNSSVACYQSVSVEVSGDMTTDTDSGTGTAYTEVRNNTAYAAPIDSASVPLEIGGEAIGPVSKVSATAQLDLDYGGSSGVGVSLNKSSSVNNPLFSDYGTYTFTVSIIPPGDFVWADGNCYLFALADN